MVGKLDILFKHEGTNISIILPHIKGLKEPFHDFVNLI